jgi:predicted DNA-binding WGR domain protein
MSAAATLINPDHLELAIRFEREASEGKSARFYELRVEASRQLNFAGNTSGYVLHVTKGSLGGKRRSSRTEDFPTLRGAIERFGHFATERRQHGYREVVSGAALSSTSAAMVRPSA